MPAFNNEAPDFSHFHEVINDPSLIPLILISFPKTNTDNGAIATILAKLSNEGVILLLKDLLEFFTNETKSLNN